MKQKIWNFKILKDQAIICHPDLVFQPQAVLFSRLMLGPWSVSDVNVMRRDLLTKPNILGWTLELTWAAGSFLNNISSLETERIVTFCDLTSQFWNFKTLKWFRKSINACILKLNFFRSFIQKDQKDFDQPFYFQNIIEGHSWKFAPSKIY